MEHLVPGMMARLTPGLALTVDVALVALLALVLWRLREDPATTWRVYEEQLREIVDGLRTLVAQSEGVARELDGKLAAHHERLRALLAGAETAARAAAGERVAASARLAAGTRAGGERAGATDAVARVRELAARGLPVEEIARRLDMPVAEVRVLIGLAAGRAGSVRERPHAVRA